MTHSDIAVKTRASWGLPMRWQVNAAQASCAFHDDGAGRPRSMRAQSAAAAAPDALRQDEGRCVDGANARKRIAQAAARVTAGFANDVDAVNQ